MIISSPTPGTYEFTESDQSLSITKGGVLYNPAQGIASIVAPEPYILDSIKNSGIVEGGFVLEGDYDTYTNDADGVTFVPGHTFVGMFGTNDSLINYGKIIATSVSIDPNKMSFISIAGGDGSTLNNYGLINLKTGSISVSSVNSVINNYGTISGTGTAIDFIGDGLSPQHGATINNSGVINGNIVFSGGSNLFEGHGGTVNGFIYGGTGNDVIDLSDQIVNGLIVGGSVNNTLSFAEAPVGMAISIAAGSASDPVVNGEKFSFTHIANVIGTAYADGVIGDPNANTVTTGAGDDYVRGDRGNDHIDGGAGNDILYGDSGTDEVIYATAASAVTVSLALQNQTQDTVGDGVDYLSGFEYLVGSNFDDRLTGDGGANLIHGGLGNDLLMGGAGNDTLRGDNGNDTLIGGLGADTLYGGTLGTGTDTFVYQAPSDSTIAAPDTIGDFVHGTDRIDLSALHLANASDVTIARVGSTNLYNVSIDSNNDGVSDMLIKVVSPHGVTASDLLGVPAGAPVPHTADLAGALDLAAADHGLYG